MNTEFSLPSAQDARRFFADEAVFALLWTPLPGLPRLWAMISAACVNEYCEDWAYRASSIAPGTNERARLVIAEQGPFAARLEASRVSRPLSVLIDHMRILPAGAERGVHWDKTLDELEASQVLIRQIVGMYALGAILFYTSQHGS